MAYKALDHPTFGQQQPIRDVLAAHEQHKITPSDNAGLVIDLKKAPVLLTVDAKSRKGHSAVVVGTWLTVLRISPTQSPSAIKTTFYSARSPTLVAASMSSRVTSRRRTNA